MACPVLSLTQAICCSLHERTIEETNEPYCTCNHDTLRSKQCERLGFNNRDALTLDKGEAVLL